MCVISGMTVAGVMTAIKVASAVATVASGVVGGISAVQSGNAKAAQYEYQAKVAQNNAKIAETNAAQERQSGLEEARLQRIKTLQTIGSQQAGLAAGNVDITSGTALDTIEDTATMGELDALMIEYNAERQAQNYEQTAANYRNQANLDYMASRNASKEGKYNAWSTALSSAGNLGLNLDTNKVAASWNNVKNSLKTKKNNLFSGGLEKTNYRLA